MTRPLEAELLLRESAWLFGLARSLASEGSAADDLVQDTWFTALTHPPRVAGDARGLRAWLGTVARNLARSRRRSEARRGTHERAAARAEALPSVSESVERVEAQRELVEAVLALPEPECELVVLRYFEELPPRVIATRLGLSGPAVRSRLARALATLRARLDARFDGGRKAWVALLVPEGLAPAARSVPGIPFVLAGLAAAVGVSLAARVLLSDAAEPLESAPLALAAPRAPVEPAHAGTEEPATPPSAAASEPSKRAEAERAAPTAPAAIPATAWTLRARFVDAEDRPLTGIELVHADGGTSWSGTSDAAGKLSIELPWPYSGPTVGSGQVWVEAYGNALAAKCWYLKLLGPGEQDL